MKKYAALLILGCLLLSGCPAKLDPGVNTQAGFKKTSTIWGIPVVHAITAGFNGSISEPNFTGPANTQSNPPK